MDQELIAYLDARFRESTQQIKSIQGELASFREEVSQSFDQVAQNFERVDQNFDRVDQNFDRVDQNFDRVDQNFDRVDGEVRQVHVLVEGLRHEIQLVAEGVIGANERLDAFREEVAQEFKDVRGMLSSSYTDLDRRIRKV